MTKINKFSGAFASMLAWDRTTPFGRPSLPEVNRIAAGSSGLRRLSGFPAPIRPRNLSTRPTLARTSSR